MEGLRAVGEACGHRRAAPVQEARHSRAAACHSLGARPLQAGGLWAGQHHPGAPVEALRQSLDHP